MARLTLLVACFALLQPLTLASDETAFVQQRLTVHQEPSAKAEELSGLILGQFLLKATGATMSKVLDEFQTVINTEGAVTQLGVVASKLSKTSSDFQLELNGRIDRQKVIEHTLLNGTALNQNQLGNLNMAIKIHMNRVHRWSLATADNLVNLTQSLKKSFPPEAGRFFSPYLESIGVHFGAFLKESASAAEEINDQNTMRDIEYPEMCSILTTSAHRISDVLAKGKYLDLLSEIETTRAALPEVLSGRIMEKYMVDKAMSAVGVAMDAMKDLTKTFDLINQITLRWDAMSEKAWGPCKPQADPS